MAIPKLDPKFAGSSAYWLARLGAVLDDRTKRVYDQYRDRTLIAHGQPNMAMFADYYAGRQPLSFATPKFREAFGGLFNEFAENLCGVVVNTLVERLQIQGFRLDAESPDSDKPAWRIWQRNNLDAKMPQALREAAIKSEVNFLIGPNPDDDTTPLITPEDPLETVVVQNSIGRRVVALKRWYDAELNRYRAFLYYPDRIEKFWWQTTGLISVLVSEGTFGWQLQDLINDDAVLLHDLRVVPMVVMANMPDLHGAGTSELADVVPIQDTINKLVTDMIVASEYGAFRQKWAIGVDIPVDPDTGQPVSTYTSSISRFWLLNPPDDEPGKQISVGEFEQTDLSGAIQAIGQRLGMLATIKRMPPHYLLNDPRQYPSGETLTAAESGLVAKASAYMLDYADPIEEIMSIGFRVIGDDARADVRDSEVIWKDPRFRTESEHVDAVLKKRALGIPDEILWGELGYTPQQVERIKTLRRAQALEIVAGFSNPFAAVTPPPQSVAPPTVAVKGKAA